MPEMVKGGRLKISCVRTRGFESHCQHSQRIEAAFLLYVSERWEDIYSLRQEGKLIAFFFASIATNRKLNKEIRNKQLRNTSS